MRQVLWPVATLLLGIACGTAAFAPEQRDLDPTSFCRRSISRCGNLAFQGRLLALRRGAGNRVGRPGQRLGPGVRFVAQKPAPGGCAPFATGTLV